MNTCDIRVVAGAPVRAHATPLLRQLAGEFAPAVAELWPAPHGDYLTLSGVRRHLVHLALALGAPVSPRLAEVMVWARTDSVIAFAAMPERPSLVRVLSRLGEAALTRADYLRLIALLDEPAAAEVLRHWPDITSQTLETLDRLPSALRRQRVVKLASQPIDTDILAAAFAAISTRPGARPEQVAERWGRQSDAAGLFGAVARDALNDVLFPPLPVIDGLEAVTSRAELRRLGRQFANCLRGDDYADRAWGPLPPVYVWPGPPPAVVELRPDPVYGWTVSQARASRNAPIEPANRPALDRALTEAGVWIGWAGAELISAAMCRAAGGEVRSTTEVRALMY